MTTVIREGASGAVQGVTHPGGTMKRRFFAALAVPALALGFAFASPGTDEAQAMPPLPDLSGYACWQVKQWAADSYSYGDYETAQYLEEWIGQYCSM
jgi:hypothetical protein